MKTQNKGYELKKSKMLTFEQIKDASDKLYLFIKVTLSFALNRVMRGEELR